MKRLQRIFGIGLLVLSPLLLVGGLIQFILPPVYQSMARIAIPAEVPTVPPNNESVGFGNAHWVQTPIEKLQSKMVLYAVITNLDLNRKWAEKYKEEEFRTEVTYLLLRKQIEIDDRPRGNRLVEVRARSDDPTEAATIVNEVVRVFREQARSRWLANHERGIRLLEDEVAKTANDSVREALEKRLIAEKSALKYQTGVPEIIDQAEPDLRPISPTAATKILYFAGGVVSALLGILLLLLSVSGAKASPRGPPPLPARAQVS